MKTAAAAIEEGEKHYSKVKASHCGDGTGMYCWMYRPAHRSPATTHTPLFAAAAAASSEPFRQALLSYYQHRRSMCSRGRLDNTTLSTHTFTKTATSTPNLLLRTISYP